MTNPNRSSSSPVPSEFAVENITQNPQTFIEPHFPLHLLETLDTLLEKLSTITTRAIQFPSLHGDLQQASLCAVHLSTRTLHTLRVFRSAADNERYNVQVLQDLVVDRLRPAAKTLITASKIEQARLSELSNSLAASFEQAAQDLTSCLTHASLAHATQNQKRLERHTLLKQKHTDLGAARLRARNASLGFEDANCRHEKAEKEEKKAQRCTMALQATQVAAMVGTFVATKRTPYAIGASSARLLATTFQDRALRAREERAVHLRARQDAREQQLTWEGSVNTLVTEMRECREEEVVESAILNVLVECVTLLRRLAGVMLQASAFWKGVSDGMETCLLSTLSSGEGHELDPAWKRQLDLVHAFWKAVSSICENATKKVDRTINGRSGIEGRQAERLEWNT